MVTPENKPARDDTQEQLRFAQEECNRLREENARLRAMLGIPESVAAETDSGSNAEVTSRTEHLDYLAGRIRGLCRHVFVLKGGMGTKQRKQIAESISVVPPDEPRMILATGSYLGEGFDDARLDTLFLTMPISWRGTFSSMLVGFTRT